MNHESLIRHLSDYAETMIKDLPEHLARSYLRGCIPYWRNVYGQDVSKQMALIIAEKFKRRASAAA